MIADVLGPVAQRRDLALAIARRLGLAVTVTSGFRSPGEQLELRQQYERCLARGEHIDPSNPDPACRYPANRPGDSAHNFGLAWDSSVQGGAAEWEAWTQLRELLGFRVPANDRVHAEVPNWRSVAAQLYAIGLTTTAPIGAASAPAAAPAPPPPPTPPRYPYSYAGVPYRCVGTQVIWGAVPPWDANLARCP